MHELTILPTGSETKAATVVVTVVVVVAVVVDVVVEVVDGKVDVVETSSTVLIRFMTFCFFVQASFLMSETQSNPFGHLTFYYTKKTND